MVLLRTLLHMLMVRPLMWFLLGGKVEGRENLPSSGPAILAANHNSHLDIFFLQSLLPVGALPLTHPVAAADYFCRTKLTTWLSRNLIGIIALSRTRASFHEDPLAGVKETLRAGKIVIIFPEGSRGEPEMLSMIKPGIAHLAKDFPDVPVIPVFIKGLGKSLPRGELALVPHLCRAFVGEALKYGYGEGQNVRKFTEDLKGWFFARADQQNSAGLTNR